MRKNFLVLLVVLLSMHSSLKAQSEEYGLKDAYQDYFLVGVAVNQRNISNPEQIALIKKNFNSITSENDMKPQPTEPHEGEFRWTNADRVADFCRANGLKMRGHCLVWHNQVGNWMFYDDNNQLVSKEVLFERMRNHILAVVSRYKDVVYCWDVVNEAITDDDRSDNPYRPTLFYKIAGDEFIAKAFEYAHEADPDALLVYNDYNAANPGKCERICQMVRKMKAQGVPIDAIGMQGHYNIYGPSAENIENAIQKYSAVVDHIHMTELDIRANHEMGGQLQFSREATMVNDSITQRQIQQYDRLFGILRRHKEVVDCVTFWNLSDRDSWLGVNNHPLLIDENYQEKPAYFVVRDFEK